MAASPSQVRSALNRVAGAGVARVAAVLPLLSGPPGAIRSDLLDVAPAIIYSYTDGSSALAADWYDDLRAEAAPSRPYAAEPVVVDRGEKIHNMVAWAAQPLFDGEPEPIERVSLRLLPEVQKEIARPFRDTITTNTQRDPAAHGWRRISSGTGCKFCRMLADKGAVYSGKGARFAAHANCHCSAEPAFEPGPAASEFQYVASQRRRSEAERARLREYLDANY